MKEVLRKIKKSRVFSLICILVFIGVCMATGSLIAYIQHESNPTDVVVSYFRAFVQQNYEKMYECLYQDDGFYIDKNMYIENMKKLRQSYVIDSYDIKEPDKKDGRKFILVTCKNDETKKSRDFVVYVESKHHGISIIPDYYVDITDMMAKDVRITLPKSDKLELNGIVISDKLSEAEKNQTNKIYQFKGILAGKYKVSATNDVYARNKVLDIRGEKVPIDLTKLKLTANDKYEKIITDNGNKVINQFYKAVRGRDKNNGKLMSMFASKKVKNKVSEYVEKSEDIIFWPEKRNVDKFKVLDMKIRDLKTDIRYDEKNKSYILTCTYKYKYVSATDTSLANSYVDRISGTCNSKLILKYKADKDKLIIENIELKNKNKKN
ncbi:MAG: hypothetical protein HFG29_08130 [Eubacterium sp.]|nr:hypothetical protein [Eubacterium sp.]